VATTLLLGLPKCSLTFHNDASCPGLLLHHAYFNSHYQFVLIWFMPTVTHVYLTSCIANNNLSKQWQPMLCCMAWLFHYVESFSTRSVTWTKAELGWSLGKDKL